MRIGITGLAEVVMSASVLLAAAVMCAAGAASADPRHADSSQQDQFVSLLEQDEIPVVDNLPALVARAHQICRELSGGTSVYAVVDEEMNGIFEENPAFRQDAGKVHRTAIRFIAVSAEVYCPSHLTDPYISDDVGFSSPGPMPAAHRQV